MPTGASHPQSSQPFSSGTEEEFALAYQLFAATGRPRILMYRCTRAVDPRNVDLEQVAKVNKFFSEFSSSGSHPGLVQHFDSLDDFAQRLRHDLIKVVVEIGKKLVGQNELEEKRRRDSKLLCLPSEEGFQGFFTFSLNEERNQLKRDALLAERNLVRLIAYVGHSYIARVGHRFGNEVTNLLEGGGRFRFVILNPWSETGLMIAIGESDQTVGGLDFSLPRVDLASIDALAIIEHSVYYKFSFLQMLEEYASLRGRFGDLIEVRLTRSNIPATVMLTSNTGFFEPYISVDLRERLRKAFHTFEIQFSKESYFYRHNSNYFDTLWKISEPYEEFIANQEAYRRKLPDLLRATSI